MRQPEVCKHQVCDHCGGRFGMVTHRWWGNKFCNRRCKNAYLREKHHTQSGWVIPRFFTFAGGACLAAAVAVAMLTLLLASANAAPSEERPVAGSSLEFNKEDGTLYIDWSGSIVAGMADDLRAALGKHDTTLNRVVLFLDSAGGKVDDGAVSSRSSTRSSYGTSSSQWCPTASCVRPCAYRSSYKARTVLRRGQASGSSTRPLNDGQMAYCEPTRRRRGGCSANTMPPLGSQCIGSKVSRP
jgi:hypothetical protein